MFELDSFKGVPRHPSVDRLIAYLDAKKAGEIVHYSVISAMLGKDAQRDGRFWLMTARNELLRRGKIFKTLPRIGVALETHSDKNDRQRLIERMRKRSLSWCNSNPLFL